VTLGFSEDEIALLKRAARCIAPGGRGAVEARLWEPLIRDLPPSVCCTVPFWIHSEHPALLGLGPKLVDETYSEDDRELLITLVNNLAVAIRNAESFEEIKLLNRDLRNKNVELQETLRELQEAIRQLTRAYVDLQSAQAQIIEKEKLERELMVAREIQRSILPCCLPALSGFDLGTRILPARAVGGDFFDLIALGPDRLGIAVGDVSDKGVPAAIFMAVTRSLIRSEASRAQSPREAMLSVNRHLLEMNDASMFVTVLYGILNGETGVFEYVRAGHDPPVLFSREGSVHRPEHNLGQPLGIIPEPALDEQSLVLDPGGTLLVYTDGITDARNLEKAFFGFDGLCAAVCGCEEHSAQSLCDHLVETVTRFQGQAPQDDDVTLVAVRRC
jgi:serine phosphatase RsbU (regulator of sigma subunit)